jgi:hypothetical protein
MARRGDEGVVDLLASLPSRARQLCLPSVGITAVGAAAIAETLARPGCNVRRVDLAANRLGDAGAWRRSPAAWLRRRAETAAAASPRWTSAAACWTGGGTTASAAAGSNLWWVSSPPVGWHTSRCEAAASIVAPACCSRRWQLPRRDWRCSTSPPTLWGTRQPPSPPRCWKRAAPTPRAAVRLFKQSSLMSV